jgi:thiamine-phosphate pyrophosphorylase
VGIASHQERLERFGRAGLYLVTSQPLSRGRSTPAIIRAALAGGVRLIQLREKEMPLPAFIRLAQQARRLTAAAGALLIINDRLDVALGVGADGVHLGQADFPVALARKLAPQLLIGASTHNLAEARAAQAAGASYINLGPVFPTASKPDASRFLGLAGVRRIAPQVAIPFSVMGGIKQEHIPALRQAGASVIAVITAVTAADDPAAAARELLKLIHEQDDRGKKLN